ncbi:unnamed protein product [Arctia plantaginis]|uniref:Uncharacterized protein n=1 Tax=Arctia plantaginis TaxID=874455 RepID=A0A8S1A4L8_ARCPL|nr:unnamed protein product [Arctia plantaginis]
MTVIKKVFFRWKEEHIIENQLSTRVAVTPRPACGMMIFTEKCLMRKRSYASNLDVYDVITKAGSSDLGDTLDNSI